MAHSNQAGTNKNPTVSASLQKALIRFELGTGGVGPRS
jgi:hypothetical protein